VLLESTSRRMRAAAALGIVIVAALVALVTTTSSVQATPFIDVRSTDWYAEAVGALSDAGVINGRADGTFGPDDPVTRAEFAVLLVRSLGLAPTGGHPFLDFPHGVWFESSVAALYNAGLTTGLSATEYGPYRTISRQQAVSLTVRALAYRLERLPLTGISLDLAPSEVETWLQGYSDRDSISAVHRPAAASACRLQLLAGQVDTTFRPFALMTRAETAGVLYEALFQTPVPLAQPPEFVPAAPTESVEPTGPAEPVGPQQPPTQPPGSVPGYQPASVGSEGIHVLWIEQRLAQLTYRPALSTGSSTTAPARP
jgi:hypothetical protein